MKKRQTQEKILLNQQQQQQAPTSQGQLGSKVANALAKAEARRQKRLARQAEVFCPIIATMNRAMNQSEFKATSCNRMRGKTCACPNVRHCYQHIVFQQCTLPSLYVFCPIIATANKAMNQSEFKGTWCNRKRGKTCACPNVRHCYCYQHTVFPPRLSSSLCLSFVQS